MTEDSSSRRKPGGFSEVSRTKKKDSLQLDSPTSTRPAFRLTCQIAASRRWDLVHADMKTAFLQGEEYTGSRDVVAQLPPEAGYPPYMGALLIKPAYGLTANFRNKNLPNKNVRG